MHKTIKEWEDVCRLANLVPGNIGFLYAGEEVTSLSGVRGTHEAIKIEGHGKVETAVSSEGTRTLTRD